MKNQWAEMQRREDVNVLTIPGPFVSILTRRRVHIQFPLHLVSEILLSTCSRAVTVRGTGVITVDNSDQKQKTDL